jgi:O-antigen/teichoic acid export membrane protein
VLVTAWGRRELPRLAALWAGREIGTFRSHLWWAAAAVLASSIGWCAALWLAWSAIERFVLAGKYPDAYRLLLPWALAATLGQLEYVVGIGLQAMREFRFLAYTQFVGGSVAIAGTTAGILWGGYTFSMYGIALGATACVAMELGRLDRQLSDKAVRVG